MIFNITQKKLWETSNIYVPPCRMHVNIKLLDCVIKHGFIYEFISPHDLFSFCLYLLKVNFQCSNVRQRTHLIMALLCPLFQMAAPLYCAQNYSGWSHFLGGGGASWCHVMPCGGVYFQYGNALSTVPFHALMHWLILMVMPQFIVLKI